MSSRLHLKRVATVARRWSSAFWRTQLHSVEHLAKLRKRMEQLHRRLRMLYNKSNDDQSAMSISLQTLLLAEAKQIVLLERRYFYFFDEFETGVQHFLPKHSLARSHMSEYESA